MRQKLSIFVVMVLFTLLIGGGLSGRVLASEGERIDPADLMAIAPDTLTLQESENGIDWSPIIGNLADGYSMVLDPANTYEYLDVATLSATPVLTDGLHEFYFDAFRAPDGFWTYWAAQGVIEGATGWQGIMWAIINGEQPMFYLNVSASGTKFALVDGLLYQLDETISPLRVNGNYPLGTYHFGGEVTDVEEGTEYLNIQITFTRQATVSLTSNTWTIDGCGYLDVFINLADVHDLYAVDLSLSFDETVLEVVDLDDVLDGDNLQSVNTWFNSEYIVYNEADNNTGIIRYAATQLRETAPANGSGNIAMIRFRAKQVGTGDISVSSAELSDRDGYLVGRPVEKAGAAITTDFTAYGGLDLDIIRLDNANVQLSWPKQTLDEGAEYNLYRSTLPYFDIGDGTLIGNTYYDVSGDPITYNDPVLGQVGDDNYFYAYGLQINCSNGFSSSLSDQVGKIEFELFETNTRDYAWIGLTLENENILDTRDLANNIESHIYSGTVNVLTVGEWNLSGQNMTNYNHINPTSIYDVFVKQPYRVEVDIDGTTSDSVIWAQVGRLPVISGGMYTFDETAITDFSWILQPLDKANITTTDQFVLDIEESGAVNVLSFGEWNGTGQNMTNVIPGGVSSFNTRFGYPYRVEVQLLNGGPVIWP